jgi:K(+)-stimulated pyrophosphate-energized sodium pump
VALNPIIKFSTLFGLLAVEIAVSIKEAAAVKDATSSDYTATVGVVMLLIALTFVWRSFYAMRIPQK